LQNAIAACGWTDAVSGEQQDTSLFFNWLAETLELPLLELRRDTYHEGKEDPDFDHKVIKERLLNIAIPDETPEGRPIKLENCLEGYFNTRVDVDRYKLERSNTISSMSKGRETPEALHVEVAEVPESNPSTPISPTRNRTNSLLYRYTLPDDVDGASNVVGTPGSSKTQKGSVAKEVRLPAFQFLNLIRPSFFLLSFKPFHMISSYRHCPVLIDDTAWLSQNPAPVGDEEISKYLKETRPTLGICLKRYAMVNGRTVRQNTKVDIRTYIRI
jgi:hypothetical protein